MRIAISQRVDVHLDRNERRDALDQAWQSVVTCWFGTSALLFPIPNHPARSTQMLDNIAPSLLVLSGGNDVGQITERDDTETSMLCYARERRIPILAVCRGFQMLQRHLGGELISVDNHVAVEHPLYADATSELPVLHVNSYHNWAVNELAAELEPIYRHADGTVEAARHRHLPWLAVMWHPERYGSAQKPANDWIVQTLKEYL